MGRETPARFALHRESRRSIFGAWFGYLADYWDILLPLVALAPAIAYFLPPGTELVHGTTLFFVVFAATLLGRPTGAFIFGHFADKMGRRNTTLVAVAGFTLGTLLMAVLPGYETWGALSLVLLIVLRFVGGVFLGGEYTSAVPLAMEASPRRARGFWSAIVMSAFPFAFIGLALLTALMLEIAPADGLGSAYFDWGWRIPFLAGVVLGVAVFAYLLLVPESEVWLEEAGSEGPKQSPLKDLFSRAGRRDFLQVFTLMTGFWFSYNAVGGVLPGLLGLLDLSGWNITWTLATANVFLFGGYMVYGTLSLVVGRRPLLIGGGLVAAIVGGGVYWLLVSRAQAGVGTGVTIALSSLLLMVVVSPFALLPAYICERFRTGVRASGYGLGYSLAAIVPAFYSFYMLWMDDVIPYVYTPIPMVVLGGILIVVGAVLGPETRDVDLRDSAPADDVAAAAAPPVRPGVAASAR